jgi:hypothetical protein
MKTKYFFMTVLAFAAAMAVTLTACNDDDKDSGTNSEVENIQLRSEALGFTDVADYESYVAGQCLLGNHENCCFLSNGTHQVCTYPNHLGINGDGTQRQGGKHRGNNHSVQGINCTNPDCMGFVDADGNGVCDHNPQSIACTNPDCTNPDCTGYVDANGDGKCDNGIGTRPQDGSGSRYGKKELQ